MSLKLTSYSEGAVARLDFGVCFDKPTELAILCTGERDLGVARERTEVRSLTGTFRPGKGDVEAGSHYFEPGERMVVHIEGPKAVLLLVHS